MAENENKPEAAAPEATPEAPAAAPDKEPKAKAPKAPKEDPRGKPITRGGVTFFIKE